MKMEIRPYIGIIIDVQLCDSEKLEVNSCFLPKFMKLNALQMGNAPKKCNVFTLLR